MRLSGQVAAPRGRGWVGAAAAAVAMVFCAGAQAATVGSKPVTASWQANGRVQTIVVSGTTAYLGGKFTSMRPSGDPLGTGEVARNGAAAIDLTTGALLPWNPNVTGSVQTIAVSGQQVYLGGLFSAVGGKSHRNLAAVDATGGAPIQTFKPTTNAGVYAVAVQSGTVYAGGAFTTADKIPRAYLAGFDAGTGALTAWAPAASAKVNALAFTSDGSRLIVGGTFASMDGASQPYLTALSPTTGGLLPWSSHPAWSIVALTVDSSGVYVAGGGNGGNLAGYDPQTGAVSWIGGVDGNVQAVAAIDGVVYFGGHFDYYCGQVPGNNWCRNTPRDHLLAVAESGGVLQAWHPSANGVLGVFSLAAGDGTLSAGGDFTKIGGVGQQGYAELSEITDPVVTDSAAGAWTAAASVTVTASGSNDLGPGFAGYRYETSTNGGATWSNLRTGSVATVKTEGQTLVRFEAVDAYGNASAWVGDLVRIDRTAPTLPSVTGGNGVVCAGLPSYTVAASGSTDAGSGLAGYAYETSADNGSNWTAAVLGASFTSADTHSGATLLVRFQAIDAAGNGSPFTVPGPASTITLC